MHTIVDSFNSLDARELSVNQRSPYRFVLNVLNVYARRALLSLSQPNLRNSIMKWTQLAKLGFVLAAGASFLFSVSLWFTGSKEQGMFVGLWVPSILSFGTLMLGRGAHE